MISAIKKLVELVGSEPINGLTPFGHQVGAKNGKIDMNLLNGAYSLEKLTQGLSEVKRNNIENIDDKHLCHRVRDHLNWMAKNMLSHGGFESRLAKVHGATQARQLVQKIAPHLKEIADSVNAEYLEKYSGKKGSNINNKIKPKEGPSMKLDIDQEKLKEMINFYAKPIWDGEEEDEWVLRPRGGELYIQKDILERTAPYFTKEAIRENVKESLLAGLKYHVNLLSQFEWSYSKDFIEQADNSQLLEKTEHLLFGSGELKSRIETFLEYSGVKPVAGSDRKIGINHTVYSYFLCLASPREYAFCKPEAYKAAVEQLLPPEQKTKDFIDRIIQCRQLYSTILDILENQYGLENGNLMDCHSLMFLFMHKGWNIPSQGTHPRPVSLKETRAFFNCNQILYGPPGTGKTYNTANLAVQICDGEVPEDRNALMERYRELSKSKRINFISFHQSYSYEEFIEGIKPETIQEADSPGEQLVYKIEDGIFKKACLMAKSVLSSQEDTREKLDTLDKKQFFKMSVGGKYDPDVEEFCFKNNYIALGWGGDVDYSKIPKEKNWSKAKADIVRLMTESKYDQAGKRFPTQTVYAFKNWIDIGDIVIVSRGLNQAQAFGVVEGEYEYKPDVFGGSDYCHFRKVKWLLLDAEIPVEKIQNKIFSQQTIYNLNREALNLDYLKDILCSGKSQEKQTPENHVLIIDEINRGNISKILGELITLIESDKRLGQDNEIKVRLPYSGEEFGVPPNLNIIGTMNTADRSLALMDTALRRRFDFIEMMPELSVLDGLYVNKIDIKQLVEIMNHRIEALYDREHTIGHTFFIPLRKNNTIDTLSSIFEHKIIPLLAEYFFEDWHKIMLVLGDNQKKDKDTCFIVEKETHTNGEDLFGKGNDLAQYGLDQMKIYLRNHDALQNEEAYIGVYAADKISGHVADEAEE